MLRDYLTRQLTVRRTDERGEPTSCLWIPTEHGSAAVKPASGRVLFYGIGREETQQLKAASLRRPLPPFWIGDQRETALVDIEADKLLAYILRDANGTYCATIYLPLLRAIRSARRGQGFLVSVRPFPRCALELPRFADLAEAERAVELTLRG